jgi:hypothetical protein
MEKELFIETIKREGTRIILSNDPDDFDRNAVQFFRELKEFTQYVNFNCQIKETGICRKMTTSSLCCCNECLSKVGYFRQMIDKNLTYYARHFSIKTGFWRKGKGCILSRKMRSVTCLTHHCNYEPKNYPGFESGMIVIANELRRLGKQI